MEMFNEEVERVSRDNLLTEKEIYIILKILPKVNFQNYFRYER
ncbi:hypothetical protein Q5M85_12840 [Paraclostridium bifermentans]|nr:hypothetical protein [Paraclostridium bifermentans]